MERTESWASPPMPEWPSGQESLSEQRAEDLSLLLPAAAHEVNNLVCALTVHAQMGLAGEEPERAREALRAVLAAAQQMGSWFSSLLAYAKGDRSGVEAVDAREAIQFTLGLLRPHLTRCGVRTHLDLEAAQKVRGEPALRRQIFFNLILNAGQAMEQRGGRIRITLRDRRDQVEIQIRDDGPGLPGEVRGRLFEPFVSGRNGNSGLGLFLASQLVRGMGGSIRAVTATGKGTLFRVRLPVAVAA